jgi:hypothetical protein
VILTQAGPNLIDKRPQVPGPMLDNVDQDPKVNRLIFVNQDVPKPGHPAQAANVLCVDPASLGEKVEQSVIRRRISQAFGRYDVRGYVEDGLNCNLEGVLGEALFSPIGADLREVHRGEVRQAQFHPGEFF